MTSSVTSNRGTRLIKTMNARGMEARYAARDVYQAASGPQVTSYERMPWALVVEPENCWQYPNEHLVVELSALERASGIWRRLKKAMKAPVKDKKARKNRKKR